MALADYQQLVDAMVRAQSVLNDTDRDRAIALAVERYSDDCGREVAEEVTWPVAGYFGPLPTTWAEGSYLLEAVYPLTAEPRTPIDMAIGYSVDGEHLMVPSALPAGAVVLVRFSAPHVLAITPTAQDSIPARHREAVASYAAHVLCKQLATYYAGERETSIGADGSNTDSRSRNYRTMAKEHRGAYYAGIGKADPLGSGTGGSGGSAGSSDAAASVTSWPGRQRAGLVRMGDLL